MGSDNSTPTEYFPFPDGLPDFSFDNFLVGTDFNSGQHTWQPMCMDWEDYVLNRTNSLQSSAGEGIQAIDVVHWMSDHNAGIPDKNSSFSVLMDDKDKLQEFYKTMYTRCTNLCYMNPNCGYAWAIAKQIDACTTDSSNRCRSTSLDSDIVDMWGAHRHSMVFKCYIQSDSAESNFAVNKMVSKPTNFHGHRDDKNVFSSHVWTRG
eukprot:GHVH01007361.1.p1 GENE.GHVH01007361.1~~GHVH01007361.1.p1  ORF type:complete len:206 (-),score=16.05 GHVH01007361.1:77-694(-)